MREERALLGHHSDLPGLGRDEPPAAGDDLAVEEHLAGPGRLEPCDDPAERGLAAARLAHQGQDLAGLDSQVDAVEHLVVTEGVLDPADL